ncbi:beta-lactamase/transpeptidase-like protein [Aspergillus avenaceus]|uniref:Beta-lactamase/transpeptidase-like protein n=1 Tax=Aspergillus avenaceus TaxID=36643 RepID=A0A5N6U655_ASPAV|nr:beta-lactamase/transpeptidase-like protein [Aspergillus avenaceus]
MLLSHIVPALSLCLPAACAGILGPVYPPPQDLTSDSSRVAAAWKNFTATLDGGLKHNDNSSGLVSQLKDLTFSVGLFSPRDGAAERLQYHHTGPEVANSSHGTNKVDGDSIYRIASVSKLVTVFAGLLELDDSDWDRPLTDIFPELADFVKEKAGNFQPVYDTQWDKITLNAIAGQLGGIPRGGEVDLLSVFASLKASGAEGAESVNPASYGLPPLDENDTALMPPCFGDNRQFCDLVSWPEGEADNAPVFLPWAAPQYANSGYIFLGLAIANLTGKSLDEVYQDTVFDPLGMTSSYTDPVEESDPNYSRTVVAGPPEANYALKGGVSKASGGLLSTTNDLAKLGIAILNSTLLPADQTRKWLKPGSFGADLQYGVGRPWEIYRYVHLGSGVVTDIYTKMGDSGYYGGILAVIPDYDVGFSVLDASSLDTRSASATIAMDLIINAILPALMQQAAIEAQKNYAGTYRSAETNSSITLAVSPPSRPGPGLAVSSWISNGTDLTPALSSVLDSKNARFVPTVLPQGSTGKAAFRTYVPPQEVDTGSLQMLTSQLYALNSFLLVDGVRYGGKDLKMFVFDIEDGRAGSVALEAFRSTLKRV